MKKRKKSLKWRFAFLLIMVLLFGGIVQAAQGTVWINRGEMLHYPLQWGGYRTYSYTAEGEHGNNTAYCMEPNKGAVPTGEYTEEILTGKPGLAEALYYGYGGPGQGEYLDQLFFGDLGVSADSAKYVLTHLAVSYFYNPDTAFFGMTEEQIAASGVMDFIQWIQNQSAPAIGSSFSADYVKAGYDKEDQCQKTTEITYLSENPDNRIIIACPEGITLYKTSSGAPQTGQVEIYANESFYFTAPLDYTETNERIWISEGLTGEKDGEWKAMGIPGSASHQSAGYGCYIKDTAKTAGFRVEWISFGSIEVQKQDLETGESKPQGKASLAGAVYGVYQNNQEIGRITTDDKGYGKIDNLPEGSYTVKEIQPPSGYEIDPETYTADIGQDNKTVKIVSKEKLIRVRIHVKKIDDETGKADPQGKGTLKGAEYTVYAGENLGDFKKDETVGKITTDEKGEGTLENLIPGKYYLKETKASEGYFLDEIVYKVDFPAEGSKTEEIITSREKAVRGKLLLEKTDGETKGSESQVTGSSFAQAVYGVYAEEDIGELKKGELAAEIKIKENGKGTTENLFYGTYRIKELKAPEGYCLDTEDYIVEIPWKSENPREIKITVQSGEMPVRGDVSISKFLKTEEGKSIKTPLEGISFTFTEVGNKKNTVTITTDKNGYATTENKRYPNGRLLYGTYEVTESNVPEGCAGIAPFQVEIKNHREKLHYIIENDEIIVPVKIVKIAEDTGKIIAREGTKFKIQKKGKEKWEDQKFLTVLYPQKVYQTVLETDKSGCIYLPEKLKAGEYRIVEVKAPKGYARNPDPVEFSVHNGLERDKEIKVRFTDKPQKGKILIKKTDKDKNIPLGEGFTFSITAGEDILTGDQTLRMKKGELADCITTGKDGTAVSKELYPGRYIIKEETTGEFYGLAQKEKEISLEADEEELFQTEVLFPNEKTKVILQKTDKEKEDVFLEGAEFSLYRESDLTAEEIKSLGTNPLDKEKRVFVTDKTGVCEIEDLCHNTVYYLVETKAPRGYVRDNHVYKISVDENGRIQGENVYTLNVENIAYKNSLAIKKIDKDTKKPLGENYYFEIFAAEDILSPDKSVIYKKGTKIEEIKTDVQGIAKSSKLFPGKYEIQEKETGEYYALDKRKYEIEIPFSEEEEKDAVRMEIENQKTVFRIKKTETGTGKPLQQVMFAIGTREDWTKERMPERAAVEKYGTEITTDENGEAVLTDLKHGATYFVTEIKTQDGYILDKSVYSFKVDSHGLIQGQKEYVMKLSNNPQNKVKTGDENNPIGFSALCLFSAGCLFILARKQKK